MKINYGAFVESPKIWKHKTAGYRFHKLKHICGLRLVFTVLISRVWTKRDLNCPHTQLWKKERDYSTDVTFCFNLKYDSEIEKLNQTKKFLSISFKTFFISCQSKTNTEEKNTHFIFLAFFVMRSGLSNCKTGMKITFANSYILVYLKNISKRQLWNNQELV